MNPALNMMKEEGIDPRNIQQGSDVWKRARLGFVTASRICDVMAQGRSGEAVTRQKLKMQLVAERMTWEPTESYSNAAMEWGVEQESFAVIEYEAAFGVLADKTGFWPHIEIPFVGASPDRLIGDRGLIEIKCPNTTTHLGYILDGGMPALYLKQVQCQLWVTGRDWCDFVSFDPRVPERHRLFVIRVQRDETMITKIKEETLAFLTEVDLLMAKLEG